MVGTHQYAQDVQISSNLHTKDKVLIECSQSAHRVIAKYSVFRSEVLIECSQSTHFMWGTHWVFKECSQSTQFRLYILIKYLNWELGGTQIWRHRKAFIWTNLTLCEYGVLSFDTITKCSFEHLVSTYWVLNACIEYFVNTLWALDEYLPWNEYFVSTLWVPHIQNWVLYERSMNTLWAFEEYPYLLCVAPCKNGILSFEAVTKDSFEHHVSILQWVHKT